MPGSARKRSGDTLDGAESPVELAIRYLTPRRRFEREIRRHLRGRRVPASEIDGVIERLGELGLLSDEDTARAWLRDRLHFSPRARRLLRLELRKQGVDERVADAALDEVVPPDAEIGIASDVLRRSRRKLEHLDPSVARRRMWGALARRGFDPETAREAIARFFEETDDPFVE